MFWRLPKGNERAVSTNHVMLGGIYHFQVGVILRPKRNNMAGTPPWYIACLLFDPCHANSSIGSTCLHPSPPMMECLYLLSSSIHNLGMSHHQSYLMTTPQRMITKFIAAFVRRIGDGDLQVLYDLSLLRHLASKWKNGEMTALLHAIDRLRAHVCHIPFCLGGPLTCWPCYS